MALTVTGRVKNAMGRKELTMMEVKLTFVGDGSGTTATMPTAVMDSIRGLYLYAIKYEDPGAGTRPAATFDLRLHDEDGFAWLYKNDAAVDSDWVLSGADTHGVLPPLLGTWTFSVADTAVANTKTFDLHLFAVS